MGTFRRYLGHRASAVLFVSICTACGGPDNEDNTEFFTGGSGGMGGSGTQDGGSNGCDVAFVTPAADGASLTLGSANDLDGSACGDGFATTVLVSSNARTVTLYVNGATNSSLSESVSNYTASFGSVQLGNRGALSNSLRAKAEMEDGRTCEVNLGREIFVDCEGPSCSIVHPAGVNYLNAGDDSSSADLFQTDFEVDTQAEHVGQAIQLALDGDLDTQLSAQVDPESVEHGRATFADITLSEGRHSAQAECRDAAGNILHSPLVEWTVDTVPCTAILAAFPPVVTPASDTVPGGDIQLVASGTTAPPQGSSDCAEIQVGLCGALMDSFSDLASDGTFSQLITLPAQTGAVDVCAQVRDEAGNTGDALSSVQVRLEAPQIAIASPANAALFNVANDGNPGSGTCEVDFQVNCEDVGSDVELLEGSTVRATQPCSLDNAVPLPFHGRATFTGVSLASRNDGTLVSMTARQTTGGVTGTSAARTIGLDCQAPAPSFAGSTPCDGQLSLTGDDTLPGVEDPGLQFSIGVLNDGVEHVELTVTRGGSPTVIEADGNGTSTQFPDVDLGGLGSVTLSACATDPQGNTGCSADCTMEISDVPVVTITVPTDGATLTTDCAPGGTLQVQVTGTTDAVDGSTAVITVGSSVTSNVPVSGGAFSECVDALTDGAGQTLSVAVTDTVKGPPAGTDSITVNVDGTPPTQTIAAPAIIQPLQRRQGIVHFQWPAVADAGGGPLAAYRMRCAQSSIDDETEWTAATDHPVSITPQTSGNEDANVGGFRVGTTVFCMVRGQDLGGSLTPITTGTNTQVNVPFLEQALTIVNSGGAFASVAPVGDINPPVLPAVGNTDLIYGALNGNARVFFGGGSPAAPNGTHDVEIIGGGQGFGAVVAGLGDISGDGRPDFAVSARALNGSRGAVYVFFGKAPGVAWPPTLNVALSPGCGEADICFHGGEMGAFLGWDMTSADVNDDGTLDLVIGARTHLPGGRVYVVFGGAQLAVGGGTAFDLPTGSLGLTPTPNGFFIDPPGTTSNFGIAVTAVNENDLVIVANGQPTGDPGRAFFATNAGTSSTGIVAFNGTLTQFDSGLTTDFGNLARALGDFSAHAGGDVAIGDFTLRGTAKVYPRAVAGFNSSTVLNFANDDPSEDDDWSYFLATGFHPQFGLLGDLDKDTFGELAVGAFQTGSLELFYGGQGVTARARSLADYHRASAGVGQIFPNFVGDFDGDTFNDIAVIDFGASITDTLTILY